MPSLSAPDEQVEHLRRTLQGAHRVAITTHLNPDGDALGSSYGLAGVLRRLGHEVLVVLPNTPSAALRWIPGHADAIAHDTDPEACESAVRGCDVLFCLDFNRTDRVGKLEEAVKAAAVKVLIDHHQDPEPFAQVVFSDTTACATAQMVYDIVAALGHTELIDADAATCLYTGMATDSGWFRFRSTTPHTMRVAAGLMERGVAVDRVYQAVSDDNTEDRLRLLGFTLSERMTVLHELGTTVIGLGREDLQRFNYRSGDTEGFVNYGLSVRGVRLSAFFAERDKEVKLSLRSRGALPVDRFAKEHFNGGGHTNAAGGQTTEPLHEAIVRFKRLLPAFISAHPE